MSTEDAQAAEKVALTDAEHNEHSELAGRIHWDQSVYTEDAVERIVAARVAEAVDRERAAWVMKVEARAHEFDVKAFNSSGKQGKAMKYEVANDLRALLSADDIEALAAAKADAVRQALRAATDDGGSLAMQRATFPNSLPARGES